MVHSRVLARTPSNSMHGVALPLYEQLFVSQVSISDKVGDVFPHSS